MADQREAVEMARRIVADETGKETASAWQVAHADGRSMSTKYGEGCDALVFLHREDAVDKAFDETDAYVVAGVALTSPPVTVEPVGPWLPLARAVIALDEECRRLQGGMDDAALDRIKAGTRRAEAFSSAMSVVRDVADSSHLPNTLRRRIDKAFTQLQAVFDAEVSDWPEPAPPGPPCPGASEPSEADVEAVAKRLMIVWMEHQEQLDGGESMLSGMSFDEASALAREAIRLGARVPR